MPLGVGTGRPTSRMRSERSAHAAFEVVGLWESILIGQGVGEYVASEANHWAIYGLDHDHCRRCHPAHGRRAIGRLAARRGDRQVWILLEPLYPDPNMISSDP